MKDAEGDLKL